MKWSITRLEEFLLKRFFWIRIGGRNLRSAARRDEHCRRSLLALLLVYTQRGVDWAGCGMHLHSEP